MSYKEQESEDENDRMTDDEDETSKDAPEEEEELDTMERVIESRDGKKGG